MKKLKSCTLILVMSVILITISVVGQENWIDNSFGPVSWKQPDDWSEIPDMGENSYGVFKGSLDDSGDLKEGCGLIVIVEENLEETLIEDMLSDRDTELTSQGRIILDNYAGKFYKGIIKLDPPIEFEIMFFKGPISGKQVAILGFVRSKLGEQNKPILEKVLKSVKLVSKDTVPSASNVLKPKKVELYIALNSQEVVPGSDLIVKYRSTGNPRDWIGLYKVNDPDRSYILWEYLPQAEGEIEFSLPSNLEDGKYEFRMFENDGYKLLVRSDSFQVVVQQSEVLEISSNVLCKKVVNGKPQKPTDVYTFSDSKVYLWTSLKPFKERHNLSWEWYSPDGKIYATSRYDLPSAVEEGEEILEDYTVWAWLNIGSINRSLEGSWAVKMYIDGQLALTRVFRLVAPEDYVENFEILSSVLCKNVKDAEPVDSTNVFTFNDERIYLWLSFKPFKDNHKVLWKWYSPDGELYYETDIVTSSAEEESVEIIDDYSAWAWLYVDSISKKLKGTWRVDIYLDGEKKLTRSFKLLDQESKAPGFKEINIEDVVLKIPKSAEYFQDEESQNSYYIILDTPDDVFAFVAVEFDHEDLIDEADFIYKGPWFTAKVVEDTSYDEEEDTLDRFWYAKIENITDNKGRYIYLFFLAPDDYFEEYEPLFREIFDSFNLIVY